ncbi:hypothetical protein U27_01033 [Candidatus Vecturithrix granuli]|uniref:Ice-binding protein C-terminal domain-containing protein n=1 Tax=Vecturithrix granuli TaxID=1499967 RepID=A0A081C980_VECG1|nr:hypothetical protein U27_01033 [Candidatus Vecturithrix granuli]
MKKMIGIVCVMFVLLSLSNPTSALQVGSWTLADGELENGWFLEQQITLPSGQTTSLLSAQSDVTQWQISDLFMVSMLPNPDGTQTATYMGGTVMFAESPGLWGEAISLNVNAQDVNQYVFTPEGQLYGLNVNMQIFGTYDDFDILISAEFHGILGQNFIYNPFDKYISGQGFTSLTLNISRSSAIPEPGTMLLLGTGLFGAVALGKKKVSKR